MVKKIARDFETHLSMYARLLLRFLWLAAVRGLFRTTSPPSRRATSRQCLSMVVPMWTRKAYTFGWADVKLLFRFAWYDSTELFVALLDM